MPHTLAVMTSVAAIERAELCDLFRAVGPDAPTLCSGWTTRDLAAHLVVRERRPDAAAGIVIPPLAGHGEKVRRAVADQPWADVVALVRRGPPLWNPSSFEPVDEFVNTLEFFVHHEDVLRAQPGWTARQLEPEVEDAIAGAIGRGGRLLTRKAGVGITLESAGRQPIRLRGGTPMVTIRGPLADCVLYVHGRKSVAQVELDGPPDAVAKVESASFGL
jgi:uncharacterized protein (TIGR03085 family)